MVVTLERAPDCRKDNTQVFRGDGTSCWQVTLRRFRKNNYLYYFCNSGVNSESSCKEKDSEGQTLTKHAGDVQSAEGNGGISENTAHAGEFPLWHSVPQLAVLLDPGTTAESSTRSHHHVPPSTRGSAGQQQLTELGAATLHPPGKVRRDAPQLVSMAGGVENRVSRPKGSPVCLEDGPPMDLSIKAYLQSNVCAYISWKFFKS